MTGGDASPKKAIDYNKKIELKILQEQLKKESQTSIGISKLRVKSLLNRYIVLCKVLKSTK